MTLGEHLDELRVRLIRSTIALTVVFAVAWAYHDKVSEIVMAPGDQKAIPWLNELMLERRVDKLTSEALPAEGPERAAYLKRVKEAFTEGQWRAGFLSRLEHSPLASGASLGDEQRAAARAELIGDPDEALQALVGRIPAKLRSDASGAGFMFYMKVCFYAALFLGGPYVLWQLWAFVAAGLYRKEKRVVYLYAPFSMLLFLAGVVFGYFYMVPYAMYFLAEMGIDQFQYDLRLELYLDFFTNLSLGLGVVFQLPILMLVLSRVGLVEPSVYGKYRGHFLVASLIFAAILTPPDPYTQIMMAGPMAVLYELGIVLAKLAARRAQSAAVVEASA